jgi:hypothetical protein
MSVDLLEALSSLFFQFGPFFLALFLPLVILTKARAWYNDANVRESPPATEEERATYRLYFLGSVACSASVFFLSMLAWWLLNVVTEHTYQVAIVDLPPEKVVDSRYFHREDQRTTAAGAILHDVYFFIEQKSPIKKGQRFVFDYYDKTPAPTGNSSVALTGATPIPLSVEYSGKSSEIFRLTPKGRNGFPALVPEDTSEVAASGSSRTARFAAAQSPLVPAN